MSVIFLTFWLGALVPPVLGYDSISGSFIDNVKESNPNFVVSEKSGPIPDESVLTESIGVPLENEASTRGVIRGSITDIESAEPIGWVAILVVETGRNTTSHEDGTYIIANVASGEITLRTQRVGYESSTRVLRLSAGDTLTVDFRLRRSSFRSSAIEVIGQRMNGNDVQVERRLDGRELRQQLGRTLAETLQNEPGMSQSSMGPAPARPVLRGLSGDRLMVLEDGRTTGDISTSAPDHALAIDPINSNHIEILRGPAALIYSSNALGGIVNVVRGQIPTELPDHFHGMISLQGETVNNGLTAGASTYGSIGNTGLRADLGYRNTSDIRTPDGVLDKTSIENFHGSFGVSKTRSWGLLGASANFYRSSYGIPGNFEGSHPEGVLINLEREQADLRWDYSPNFPFIRRYLVEYTFSHYYHEELEFSPRTGGFDLVGSEFSLFTNTLNARAFHDVTGILSSGIIGFHAEHSNYTAGGFTFTPQTNQYKSALYSYQQIESGKWMIQSGLRLDFNSVRPVEEVETAIGLRRQRDFFNLSGGIYATYRVMAPLSTSIALMRTVRTPGIEELFSEGPHLPAYSFEVGNPDLNAEIGHGMEWNFQYATKLLGFKNSWFFNQFDNYLYPRNTGEMSVRRPLPIYQYEGDAAYMWGSEVLIEARITSNLRFSSTLSYVQGTLTDSGEPLPFIPPLTGKSDVNYTIGGLTIGSSLRYASSQERLGEFEERTDGYVVWDFFTQYIHNHRNRLHTFSLTVENVTDNAYRMHLSRVKSIMPEPGRNVKLLYRVYF